MELITIIRLTTVACMCASSINVMKCISQNNKDTIEQSALSSFDAFQHFEKPGHETYQ